MIKKSHEETSTMSYGVHHHQSTFPMRIRVISLSRSSSRNYLESFLWARSIKTKKQKTNKQENKCTPNKQTHRKNNHEKSKASKSTPFYLIFVFSCKLLFCIRIVIFPAPNAHCLTKGLWSGVTLCVSSQNYSSALLPL